MVGPMSGAEILTPTSSPNPGARPAVPPGADR
jgi:hypothetical protein